MGVLAGGLRCRGVVKRGNEGNPLISIVIAVLNRVDCIGRAIESVAIQSYKNIELIIIDGGSTDGTLDVLKEYNTVIDYWISEPDKGIYDALNKGISVACGDWINIQGSDDFLYNTLSEVAPKLTSNHTVYYGDLFYQYQKNVKFGRVTAYQLANYRFGHHRFFFPRKFFTEYSYNAKYCICADYEMVVRAYTDKHFDFEYMPITVASYNERDGASSCQIDLEFNRCRYKFLRSRFPLIYVWSFYLRKFVADVRRV